MLRHAELYFLIPEVSAHTRSGVFVLCCVLGPPTTEDKGLPDRKLCGSGMGTSLPQLPEATNIPIEIVVGLKGMTIPNIMAPNILTCCKHKKTHLAGMLFA